MRCSGLQGDGVCGKEGMGTGDRVSTLRLSVRTLVDEGVGRLWRRRPKFRPIGLSGGDVGLSGLSRSSSGAGCVRACAMARSRLIPHPWRW